VTVITISSFGIAPGDTLPLPIPSGAKRTFEGVHWIRLENGAPPPARERLLIVQSRLPRFKIGTDRVAVDGIRSHRQLSRDKGST